MFEIEKMKLEKVEQGLEPFVDEFFQNRVRELSLIKQHVNSSNYAEAMKITHNWKGFCKPYGFAYLGDLAKGLEEELKQQNESRVRDYIECFDKYFEIRAIEKRIEEQQRPLDS